MGIFKKATVNRSKNWAFMEKFVIPNLSDPTEVYLTRYRVIQTPLFAIMVHRMDGPDSRATLHDHPWDFLSIVLKGGYVEFMGLDLPHLDSVGREVTRFNFKKAKDAHWIDRLLRTPTWTLVFAGRRKRVWGYWDRDGWTRYDDHIHSVEFGLAIDAREEMNL